jgi:cell division protein FtsI (penicillin-binding protein 3)
MNDTYKSRTTVVFLACCLLYCIIIANLYRIQILQHDFFVHLGEQQYNVTVTTPPPRAPIYDRSGKVLLAFNKDSVAAFVLPKKISSLDTLEPFLERYFPQALERLDRTQSSYFMYIARKLTDEQLNLIQEHDVPDIQLLNEPSRYYAVPCAGHTLGITDIDNKGLFGLELLYNNQLAGKPTTYFLEKDARSGRFYFKKQTAVAGKDGAPLHLTLDANLQFLAYEELKATIAEFNAKEGAVIVMDPKTGHILAMAIFPDFDPNNTRQICMELTKNKIITEEYELGSVCKVFVAMAALEEGLITLDELIDCENVLTTFIDGRRVNTVKSSVAGIIPFHEVIEKSNNIGIAKVARRLGTKLYEHYIKIGFGKKTGIEFIGERTGFVNPPHNWSKQSIFSLSYGYEITTTLLQLACAFSMIANKGYTVQPTLIMGTPPRMGTQPLYTPETIETIQQILEGTVLYGSAKKARIQGYKVMSKTGTANILVDGKYDSNRNMYTCAGIIEKGDYQRVIVTFVRECPKKNMYASMVTAPLLERVAQKTLINDKIL